MKLAAAILLFAVTAVSPEIRYFRYERPVLNQAQRPGQTCLLLDAAVFAHAAPQLADLRVYHQSTETPYVIRLAAPGARDGEINRAAQPGCERRSDRF